MKPSKPKTPRPISPPDLPPNLATPLFPITELATGLQVSEVALGELEGAGQAAENLVFDASLLEHANLSGTRFKRLRMRDVRFLKANLSNADWSWSQWDRVEVHEGRLTGLKALESKLADVRFVQCKLDLAQFRHASLRDVGFEGCILRDADFQGAELTGVSFRGCDLAGANFTGAKLEHADFRGVRLDGLVLRPADLKGMIIESGQALEFATSFAEFLGMTVADR